MRWAYMIPMRFPLQLTSRRHYWLLRYRCCNNFKKLNMTTRTFSLIETATNEMVGAFKIKNVLPTRNLRQVDPFLLIHHMQPFTMQPGQDTRIPPHPHAGFE